MAADPAVQGHLVAVQDRLAAAPHLAAVLRLAVQELHRPKDSRKARDRCSFAYLSIVHLIMRLFFYRVSAWMQVSASYIDDRINLVQRHKRPVNSVSTTNVWHKEKHS